MPNGWIDVGIRVKVGKTGNIPSELLSLSENMRLPKNSHSIIAADPESFQDVGATYLTAVAVPLEVVGLDPEHLNVKEALDALEKSFESLAQKNKDKGMALLEISIVQVNGVSVLRIVTRIMNNDNSLKKFFFHKTLGYIYFLREKQVMLNFYTPEEKWANYLPIFEKTANQTIHGTKP